MAALLTSDDIDGIAADAVGARDPRRYATELVDAVEQGRLADPDDAGYALSLVAEIREQAGDQDEALALSARSVTASEGTRDASWLRATHAERLLRLGHDDDGMAELRALRPLLHREPGAADHIVEALTADGRTELAEQWLTAALTAAIEREDRAEDGSDEQVGATWIVDDLVGLRRSVRSELGLAPDEYDAMADELDAAPDLTFWPQAAFAQLLAAQPDAAQSLGADWDAHRALVERALQADDAEGFTVDVEIATPGLLAATLGDAGDADGEPGPRLAWPPGRNDPCWCGSRAKYKKCCLPRGRDAAASPGVSHATRPRS